MLVEQKLKWIQNSATESSVNQDLHDNKKIQGKAHIFFYIQILAENSAFSQCQKGTNFPKKLTKIPKNICNLATNTFIQGNTQGSKN